MCIKKERKKERKNERKKERKKRERTTDREKEEEEEEKMKEERRKTDGQNKKMNLDEPETLFSSRREVKFLRNHTALSS